MNRKTAWLLRYDELTELIEDIRMNVPDVLLENNSYNHKYLEGIEMGLAIALECCERRKYEAYEIDLQHVEVNA